MNNYNVYGGPVFTGPPPTPNENEVMVYKGRPFGQQQTSYNPGGFGYNQVPPDFMNPPQPNPYQQQPMMGFGYQQPMYQQPQNPMYYQQQPMMQPMGFGFQQPMMQQQFNFGYQQPQQPMGRVNPAFALIQQNPALANAGSIPYNPYNRQIIPPSQQQFQDRVIHVPGVDMGFGRIYPTDVEDQLANLQVEYMNEVNEALAKAEKTSQGIFNNNPACNYYGMMNTYSFTQSIDNKYAQKVADICNQGLQRGSNLAKHLSKLCHNYLGDPISDEDLDRIYSGYDVVIPGAQMQQDAIQADLARFRVLDPKDPRDNPYLAHFLAVKRDQDILMKDVHNLNDFLEIQGYMKSLDMLDEEWHRRRDATRYYDRDFYRAHLIENLAKKGKTADIQELQAEKQAEMRKEYTDVGDVEFGAKKNIPFGDHFPILNESMTLEDGVFNLSFPKDMDKAYKNLAARNFVEEQGMEAHFEDNRRRFLQSIYEQPMEILPGGPPNGS